MKRLPVCCYCTHKLHNQLNINSVDSLMLFNLLDQASFVIDDCALLIFKNT